MKHKLAQLANLADRAYLKTGLAVTGALMAASAHATYIPADLVTETTNIATEAKATAGSMFSAVFPVVLTIAGFGVAFFLFKKFAGKIGAR